MARVFMPNGIVPFTGGYTVVNVFAEPQGTNVSFSVGERFPPLEAHGEFGYLLQTLSLPDPAAVGGVQAR